MNKMVSVTSLLNGKRHVRGSVTAYIRRKIYLLSKEGIGKAIRIDPEFSFHSVVGALSGLRRAHLTFRQVGITKIKNVTYLFLKAENVNFPSPTIKLVNRQPR